MAMKMIYYIPIESDKYPGYFKIPNFKRYVISNNGVMIDTLQNEFRQCHRNPAGYYNFFIYKDDGVRTTVCRHRLLAITFKYPGCDFASLVVNHKNGIKGDDRLDNLEWTTQLGNIHHAGMNGLTDKCIPVAVRDSLTGEVKEYSSIIECAREYGVTKDYVNYRVKIGETRIFPEGKQYRKQSDKPWYIPRDIKSEIKNNGTKKGILVRNLFYNTVTEYQKISDFCEETNIHPSTLTKWLSLEGQPILPGLIQIKRSTDDSNWRDIEDPIAEYNAKSQFDKIVQVQNAESGKRFYFLSAIHCCRELNIKPTALDYRLKTEGKKIFSDGNLYSYYQNSPAGQKWSDGILFN